jgi:hypothetical protein
VYAAMAANPVRDFKDFGCTGARELRRELYRVVTRLLNGCLGSTLALKQWSER